MKIKLWIFLIHELSRFNVLICDCYQVHFVPGHNNKLLSASVDGLMCLFDTSGDINDDDQLDSVSRICPIVSCLTCISVLLPK